MSFLFCGRLETHHFITEMSAYLLQCMYVAKLPMILLPQANLVVPTFSIALAVSPPYLLMKSEQGRQQERLQPWQVLLSDGFDLSELLEYHL